MIRYTLLYYLTLFVLQMSRLVPKSILYKLSHYVMKYKFQKSQNKISTVEKNLHIVFGELDLDVKTKLIDSYLLHHSKTIIEMILAITNRLDLKTLIVDYDEVASKMKSLANNEGKGTIFLTAHYSNWEILGLFTGEIGLSMTIVRKTMRNPLIYERIITPFRTQFGHKEYERKGALKGITRALRDSENVGLLIDEAIPPPNGILVDFFSQPAYTLKSIAQLKLKYDPDIIPIFIERMNDGKFRINILEKLEHDISKHNSNEDKILAMTRDYNSILEIQIQKNPAQWQWSYERWREIRKEII